MDGDASEVDLIYSPHRRNDDTDCIDLVAGERATPLTGWEESAHAFGAVKTGDREERQRR
jgi:hypothetical protein